MSRSSAWLKYLALVSVLAAIAVVINAQQVGPGGVPGAGLSFTCNGANNCAALNAANVFTAAQTIGSGNDLILDGNANWNIYSWVDAYNNQGLMFRAGTGANIPLAIFSGGGNSVGIGISGCYQWQNNAVVDQVHGARDAASGRVVTQPSGNPAVNQALATSAMGTYRAGLESAIHKIAGAKLAAIRDEKNPKRLVEKIAREGQPAQTVSDYGAAQISVDSPQAKDAVVHAVRAKFPILREQDNFAQGDPEYGYRRYTMQVGMPNGSSEELQIVPREVFEANGKEHHDYKAARNAQIAAKTQNDAAMEKFNRRNGVVNRIHEAKPGELVKGATVLLRDGSRGTISYLDPNMKIARVRTDKGKNVTVRRGELKLRDQGSGKDLSRTGAPGSRS